MDKSIYLFHGPDTFQIKSKINNLINKYNVDDFNVSNYDMEEDDVSIAINDAETIPFMSEKKIVVLRNSYFLSTEAPKKEAKKEVAKAVKEASSPKAKKVGPRPEDAASAASSTAKKGRPKKSTK